MTGAPSSPVSMSGLNEDLDTNALDLDPTDQGLLSTIIRLIAGAVGKCCRPRQILVILRLLKAVTFCFLILTVCASLMYIMFVEFLSSDATGNALGGVRDTIVRIYGVALAVLAILIELDITAAVRHFSGLKAFVPRGLLLFFVATITNASLLVQRQTAGTSNNGGNYNDDGYGGGDDTNAGDDYLVDDDAAKYENIVEQPMPNSAVAFQMVVSWVLAACSLVYLVLGLLCFDRFTSRAFLSHKDPIASTAISQGNASHQTPPQIALNNYNPPGGVGA